MSDVSQTTDDLDARIRDLFSEATAAIEPDASTDGFDPAEDLDDERQEELRSLGADARTILSKTDPASLLAVLGLDDGDGPGSIPAAILAGDADDVAELRILLSLSRLVPDEGPEKSDAPAQDPFTADERDALATVADLLCVAETDDGAADGQEGEVASETPDDHGDEDSDDAITSILQEALESVRIGLDAGPDRDGEVAAELAEESETNGDEAGGVGKTDDSRQADDADGTEDVTDGLVDTAGAVVDEAGDRLQELASGGGGTEREADDESARGTADDGDEDETVLGGGDERSRQSVSGFARGTYSTIPSQNRPDFGGVRRYSTMPER